MNTPEHYVGRPCFSGAATKIAKPLILPSGIVQVLRIGHGYSEDCADIAELGIGYYQDGKNGQAFDNEALDVPGFPARIVEMMERFLWV